MMHRRQDGFTILELMIATMIFSVILITLTTGVMYFTKSYYKGVHASSTQDAARSISEKISQEIQFSKSDVTVEPVGDSGYICAGNSQFVYRLGDKVDDSTLELDQNNPYNHILTSIPITAGTCAAPNSSMNEKDMHDLLGKNMRLAYLDVSGSGDLYTIDVVVAYGDNDLLCNPDNPATCIENSVPADSDLMSQNVQCKTSKGAEFCAVTHLTTTVQKRLK